MNTETYRLILAALAPLVVGLVIARAYYLRRQRKVFMRGTDILTKNVGELRVQLDLARARADRYYLKISEALAERDQWHQLWQEQSIGHGNAQNLMMATIEEMGRLLEKKGVKYQLNPMISAVRAEYIENHEMPAREDLKQQQETERARSKAPPTSAQ